MIFISAPCPPAFRIRAKKTTFGPMNRCAAFRACHIFYTDGMAIVKVEIRIFKSLCNFPIHIRIG